MEEDMHLASEENIPMSSWSWLWKKKCNSIFPAAESQSKAEAWVHTGIPSSSQVTEESLRSDAEPKSQSTTISSIPLPGSIPDCMDDLQTRPSCAVKNMDSDEESGHGEIRWGQFLLNKLRLDENKLSSVKCLTEKNNNKTAVQKGHPKSPELVSYDNQIQGYLSKEQQPYIPYRLAKLYITKLAKDMQQMKIEYTKVIHKLECARRESQEEALTAVKTQYNNKMKTLAAQLKAYQEMVAKKNQYWQDRTMKLEDENRKLRRENEEFVNQLTLQKEAWNEEKALLLKSTSQKLDCLCTEHILTIKELQRIRLNLENIQKIVDFQMDLPCDQQRTFVVSNAITENRATGKNASNKVSAALAQGLGTAKPSKSSASFVVEMEAMHDGLLQKKLLLEVKTTLELVKGSLQKRATEISELLQSEENYC